MKMFSVNKVMVFLLVRIKRYHYFQGRQFLRLDRSKCNIWVWQHCDRKFVENYAFRRKYFSIKVRLAESKIFYRCLPGIEDTMWINLREEISALEGEEEWKEIEI